MCECVSVCECVRVCESVCVSASEPLNNAAAASTHHVELQAVVLLHQAQHEHAEPWIKEEEQKTHTAEPKNPVMSPC